MNVSVTFEVGASEACFEVEIYMDGKTEVTEQFLLKIVGNTEEIVVDENSGITVVAIVDTGSRGCCVQHIA